MSEAIHHLTGPPKIAIIHYWRVGLRGGEKVLESLYGMFPHATTYIHAFNRDRLNTTINRHRTDLSRVDHRSRARRYSQGYLTPMARLSDERDLSGYDLIVSSGALLANVVVVPPGLPHTCDCHAPMRHNRDQYHAYRSGAGIVQPALMPRLAHRLRNLHDRLATRMGGYIATFAHLGNRIKGYSRRSAPVENTPVEIPPKPVESACDFFPLASEFVSNKYREIATSASTRTNKPRVAAVPSHSVRPLRETVGPSIPQMGRMDETIPHGLSACCMARISPKDKDFSMISVEVMAQSRQVIALRRGEPRTIVHGETGPFCDDATTEGATAAVVIFERDRFDALDPMLMRARVADLIATTIKPGSADRLAAVAFAWQPPLVPT